MKIILNRVPIVTYPSNGEIELELKQKIELYQTRYHKKHSNKFQNPESCNNQNLNIPVRVFENTR